MHSTYYIPPARKQNNDNFEISFNKTLVRKDGLVSREENSVNFFLTVLQ